METFHCLAFWILVVCHYTWSQQVDGRYSQWTSWSACSRSCDGGIKYRSRLCTNPPPAEGGLDCWSLGPPVESQTCNTHKCPVHGGYSQWSSWSRCSRSCAGGAQRRSRSCTNPFPANGGRHCSGQGEAKEFRKCNNHDCPVHGGYSQWSSWSQCSQSCDGGTKQRNRSCTNPPPAKSGKDCSRLGRATASRKCNTFGCPVHGGYSQWSRWNSCSKSCGGGFHNRHRSCTKPRPKNGGRDCSRLGQATESKRCNAQRCPERGKRQFYFDEFDLCGGVVPACSAVQWILRCKFSNSHDFCTVNRHSRRIECAAANHEPGGLICCEVRCPS